MQNAAFCGNRVIEVSLGSPYPTQYAHSWRLLSHRSRPSSPNLTAPSASDFLRDVASARFLSHFLEKILSIHSHLPLSNKSEVPSLHSFIAQAAVATSEVQPEEDLCRYKGFYNPSKRYYVKGVINALLKYAAVGIPMAAAIIWHCHLLFHPWHSFYYCQI
ncbi:hypothetical protein CK203_006147 [Vitis vinifera]|uniref:Uncharacterized protein n=1 Tax=Vitis vinifera TaxID=29760 RepID=A0A438K5I7_VITVI|nr:hypothetical protein CK203_006147 [Vitis vinifera]